MRRQTERQPVEMRSPPKIEKIYEGPTVLTSEAISVQAHLMICDFGRYKKEHIFEICTFGPKYILTSLDTTADWGQMQVLINNSH